MLLISGLVSAAKLLAEKSTETILRDVFIKEIPQDYKSSMKWQDDRYWGREPLLYAYYVGGH